MAALVTVVMFDQVLYKTGHMANRWMHVMVANFEANAKIAAPKRTGDLARGINGNARRIGPRELEGIINSTAPYSTFVLGGTTGPIYSNKGFAAGGQEWRAYDNITGRMLPGFWLHLPPWGSHPSRILFSVRGQAPNNFLIKAWRKTARRHSCLRGVGIPESIRF